MLTHHVLDGEEIRAEEPRNGARSEGNGESPRGLQLERLVNYLSCGLSARLCRVPQTVMYPLKSSTRMKVAVEQATLYMNSVP